MTNEDFTSMCKLCFRLELNLLVWKWENWVTWIFTSTLNYLVDRYIFFMKNI